MAKNVNDGEFTTNALLSVGVYPAADNDGIREFSFRFDGPVPMRVGAEASIVVTSITREVVER